jgi:flavin reductase (DIM6/NTAB) family NADH-FMN oxidoreductase RutF
MSIGLTCNAGARGILRAMRVSVALEHSWRLLNHGPTTLITTAHAGRRNVMAAAWVMPIDFTPPKIIAVVAQSTLTREMLEASRACVLHAPTTEQLRQTYAAGSVSGRDTDKFAELGLRTAPASIVEAPLIEGCAAWLECKVIEEPAMQERYDMFVLECVAAWADDTLFQEREWRFPQDGPRTIHHSKGGVFFATGERMSAR